MYNVAYLSPSVTQVCMYSQYLANAYKAISSVKNYMSGAKSWVFEHGGNVASFLAPQLDTMIKSLTKKSTHVVKRAFPLSFDHVYAITCYLDSASNVPPCVKSCILLGYSCYLRSSNLVAPNFALWQGDHTILARDIISIQGGLRVVIPSTKSRRVPYDLIVPSNSIQSLCPVRAWHLYKSAVQPDPSGPAFMLSKSSPLTPGVVVRFMRYALAKYPNVDVQAITMHSLRRGAAQAAEDAGASASDIMARGGWKSKSGLTPYLVR